jgi:hypothetical protein
MDDVFVLLEAAVTATSRPASGVVVSAHASHLRIDIVSARGT